MRVHSVMAGAASLLIVLLPFEAQAQQAAPPANQTQAASNVGVRDRARPEYDAPGIQLGGFDLHGALNVDAENNDNIFATPTNTESDTLTAVGEQLTLASHWSRHSLAFAAGGLQTYHQDFDQDDTQDHYFRADGRLDIYTDTEAGAGGSINREHEARTDPDAPGNVAEPIRYDRNDAYAYIRHTFNRVRLTGRYERVEYDYKDAPLFGGGILDQDFRDFTMSVATARAEVAITPRTAVVLEGDFNKRDYDTASIRDSDGHTYLAGVSFDVTDLVRGEVTVGHFDQNYDDPAIGKVTGTAYGAHVDWFPTQLTTVQFNARRAVEESAIPGATYLHSEASARVDHELLRNLILSAAVSAGKLEYSGIDRTDNTFVGDLGAEYLVNRRIRLHAGYQYDRNDSSGLAAGRDFKVNRVFAGVSFRL